MAFHVRDPETDALVRKLARQNGVGITEAVKVAVCEKIERDKKAKPMLERIRAIQDEVASWPDTGLKADKAFFDELSGDED
jgi:antitoxin VapB